MSRTYRRKNLKRHYYNYTSCEQFERLKSLTQSDNPYPEQWRGWSGWGHMAPQELWDHREAQCFLKYSHGIQTYEEFVAHEDAMFHSERGWLHTSGLWRGMRGEVTGIDRNRVFERPHRAAMRQFIHRCVADDAWDDTVVPDYKSRGWWMYYD